MDNNIHRFLSSRELRFSILRILIVVVAALIILGTYRYDISSICPLCLRHAYIKEYRILGIPLYSRIIPLQQHCGLGSSAAFSPGIPKVNPDIYSDITGHECRHDFRHGGFGMSGIIGHYDGSFSEWRKFLPRIDATTALYGAYCRVKNKKIACDIYSLIDGAYPMKDDDWSQIVRKNSLFAKGRNSHDKSWEEDFGYAQKGDMYCIALCTVIYLYELASDLENVQNDGEFLATCKEYKEKFDCLNLAKNSGNGGVRK